MFSTLIHTYILTILGLHEKREEDIESIEEALERIVRPEYNCAK